MFVNDQVCVCRAVQVMPVSVSRVVQDEPLLLPAKVQPVIMNVRLPLFVAWME